MGREETLEQEEAPLAATKTAEVHIHKFTLTASVPLAILVT